MLGTDAQIERGTEQGGGLEMSPEGQRVSDSYAGQGWSGIGEGRGIPGGKEPIHAFR